MANDQSFETPDSSIRDAGEELRDISIYMHRLVINSSYLDAEAVPWGVGEAALILARSRAVSEKGERKVTKQHLIYNTGGISTIANDHTLTGRAVLRGNYHKQNIYFSTSITKPAHLHPGCCI